MGGRVRRILFKYTVKNRLRRRVVILGQGRFSLRQLRILRRVKQKRGQDQSTERQAGTQSSKKSGE
jgi:hypothetical protein